MNRLIPAVAGALALAGAATLPASAADADMAPPAAKNTLMTTVPDSVTTISTYSNEDVYDVKDNKLGAVNDLLVDQDGRVHAVIIGVGGFLGVGEKDVAVPFNVLKVTKKGGTRYLVLDTTKQALDSAPGYVFDEANGQWKTAQKPD
ncbi:MAG: PRC-barrel domain-containing protein [Methyloceanibacter sp.]